MYDREISRKDSLTSSLQLTMVSISAVGTCLFFLSGNSQPHCLAHDILSILAFISLLTAIIYFIFSLSNFLGQHVYREHPLPSEVLNYQRQCYDPANPEDDKFRKWFEDELSKCATHNFEVNRRRTESNSKSKVWVVVSFLFVVILALEWIVTLNLQR